jgi:multidrug resistance protein
MALRFEFSPATTPGVIYLSQSRMEEAVSIESMRRSTMNYLPHWRLVLGHSLVTDAVIQYQYSGSGTETDPYLIQFISDDPQNPMTFSSSKKWFLAINMSLMTLAVAFVSTAYTSSISQIAHQFDCSTQIATLGVALFVLGFALGPLLWGPLSEIYGRQPVFIATYTLLTAMIVGGAYAKSISMLVIFRLLAGIFGGSSLTNGGGVIADLFPASQRSLGMSLFVCGPFLGPTIGPVVGGFVDETSGWRWVEKVMAIFVGVLLIFGVLTIPETYSPVILGRRARTLEKCAGVRYISMVEAREGKVEPAVALKRAFGRPWIFLFREPIVLLLSVYMAIIYGTLFMFFSAFPIVYQQVRGWSQGVGGLAFSGIAAGIILGLLYNILDNRRYNRVQRQNRGIAPPEARLPPAMVASVCLPVGMLTFAWTNYPTIHWSIGIICTSLFGFGMMLAFMALMNYLIDAYTIYAATVLAANTVLRSLFGAIFPMFTKSMYDRLGIHWASSIPGFLSLACLPVPFLFYRHGDKIRKFGKYSVRAELGGEQNDRGAMENGSREIKA